MPSSTLLRRLGRCDYPPVWDAMRTFTDRRTPETPDEIWLLEHTPVFTQGLNGKPEHLLDPGEIPVIQVDRGGQVTYHAPGQLVFYLLLDLKRRKLGVRPIVTAMEQAVIELLAGYGLESRARQDAPGVYVDEKKVASLGLRIRHGCSYHGLSLNVDMDLEPFSRINPCGYEGLAVSQLRDLGISDDIDSVGTKLVDKLAARLDINTIRQTDNQLPLL